MSSESLNNRSRGCGRPTGTRGGAGGAPSGSRCPIDLSPRHVVTASAGTITDKTSDQRYPWKLTGRIHELRRCIGNVGVEIQVTLAFTGADVGLMLVIVGTAGIAFGTMIREL